MRSRAQVVASLVERISLTRDIALFSLASYLIRRGYDFSFTLSSQTLKLPKFQGSDFQISVWQDA